MEPAKRIERGDLAAKERMITSNLRLVVSIARRYESLGLTGRPDPGGVIGLIRATEKFDWRKGFKFSTYATWWIRQAVQRGVANKARTIRIPVHVVEREQKVARRASSGQLGRAPSDEEIAAAAELDVREVRATRDIARVVTSLDRPVGEGGDHARRAARERRHPHRDEEVEHRRCATTPCGGRSTGCPSPSATSSSSATAIGGDEPTPLRETGPAARDLLRTRSASSSARRSRSSPGAASSRRSGRRLSLVRGSPIRPAEGRTLALGLANT